MDNDEIRKLVKEPSEVLVLLALAEFADADGDCWPTVPRLAGRVRTTERKVRRLLRILESKKCANG